MLRTLNAHVPHLANFVNSCYDLSHPSHLICGEHLLLSAEGTAQGDVLGPLLFYLTLHDALEIVECDDILDQSADESIHFFLDDGYFFGRHTTAIKFIELLGGEMVQVVQMSEVLAHCTNCRSGTDVSGAPSEDENPPRN